VGIAVKQLRLTRSNDIRAVFRSGKRLHDPHLRVVFRPNELGHPRFCVPVSRKVAKRAVVRNRIRRRIREAFWEPLKQMNQGIDLVVLARHTVAELPWAELTRRSRHIVKQLAN